MRGAATWPTARSSSSRATASSSRAASVIADHVLPLLARIAEGAERRRRAQVLITGHTDNQPIRTLALSRRTGISRRTAPTRVKTLLGESGSSPSACAPKASADAEPVDPSPTPAGRARQPARRDHPHRSFERSMSTASNVNTGAQRARQRLDKLVRFLLHPLLPGAARGHRDLGPRLVRRPADRDRRIADRSIRTWIRVTVIAVLFGLLLLRAIFRVWSQRRSQRRAGRGHDQAPEQRRQGDRDPEPALQRSARRAGRRPAGQGR